MKKDNKASILFFSENMKNSIPFSLDPHITSDKVYSTYEQDIKKIISEEYPNSKPEDFDFYLIDTNQLKTNKAISRVKLFRNLALYNLLQGSNIYLFYMPVNPIDNSGRMRTRNKILEDRRNISSNDKLVEIQKGYLTNKIVDNLYTNKMIYYFDYNKKTFINYKANLNNIQLTIPARNETIELKGITRMECGDINLPRLTYILEQKNKIVPKYFIVMTTAVTQIILGCKNQDSFEKWKNAINLAINKCQTFLKDLEYQMEINNSKNSIADISHGIFEHFFEYEKLLKIDERNKILNLIFNDKKIAKIIGNSILYKKAIKNKNYKEGFIKLNEIIDIIDKNNKDNNGEKNNINNFIKQESYNKYLDVYNKAKDLICNQKIEELGKILKEDLLEENINYLNKSDTFDKGSQKQIKYNIKKIENNFFSYTFMETLNFKDENSFLLLDKENKV